MSCKFVNNSVDSLTGLKKMAEDFFPYAQEQMGFDQPVCVVFQSDSENAENILGKTAYYDPAEMAITLFTDNRHPKDILRSLSHELVHHTQNCRGDFDREMDTSPGYAQKDDHLRDMEREAYEQGNLVFRDWEDLFKQRVMNENMDKKAKITKEDLIELIKKELTNVINETGPAFFAGRPHYRPRSLSPEDSKTALHAYWDWAKNKAQGGKPDHVFQTRGAGSILPAAGKALTKGLWDEKATVGDILANTVGLAASAPWRAAAGIYDLTRLGYETDLHTEKGREQIADNWRDALKGVDKRWRQPEADTSSAQTIPLSLDPWVDNPDLGIGPGTWPVTKEQIIKEELAEVLAEMAGPLGRVLARGRVLRGADEAAEAVAGPAARRVDQLPPMQRARALRQQEKDLAANIKKLNDAGESVPPELANRYIDVIQKRKEFSGTAALKGAPGTSGTKYQSAPGTSGTKYQSTSGDFFTGSPEQIGAGVSIPRATQKSGGDIHIHMGRGEAVDAAEEATKDASVLFPTFSGATRKVAGAKVPWWLALPATAAGAGIAAKLTYDAKTAAERSDAATGAALAGAPASTATTAPRKVIQPSDCTDNQIYDSALRKCVRRLREGSSQLPPVGEKSLLEDIKFKDVNHLQEQIFNEKFNKLVKAITTK